MQDHLEFPALPVAFSEHAQFTAKAARLLAEPGAIVVLTAAAGTGKTTAIAHALHDCAAAVAWVTLDRFDNSPHRLLALLARAVHQALPTMASVPAADGEVPVGAAAESLARSVTEPLIVVIDELEHVAESSTVTEVIAPFITPEGPWVRTVLISRRMVDLGGIFAKIRTSRVGFLSESDLGPASAIPPLLAQRPKPDTAVSAAQTRRSPSGTGTGERIPTPGRTPSEAADQPAARPPTRESEVAESVEALLRAGDLDRAEEVAGPAILDLVRSRRLALVERWLDAFGPARVATSDRLTAADMLVAMEREEYARACACADRLRQLTADHGAQPDAELVPRMAWCYFVLGRIADAEEVLANAEPGPAIDVVRFVIEVELVDRPVHYRDRPPNSGTEVDALLAHVDLRHGRFDRALETRAAGGWTEALTSCAGALFAMGDPKLALNLFDQIPEADQGWSMTQLKVIYMSQTDHPEAAWAALMDGRERLVRSGSGLTRMDAWLTEAMLALQLGGDTSLATAALRAAEREPTALVRASVMEQLAMWNGLVGLLDGNHESAARHLREAVGLMSYWDRRLLLPWAAVYLSEAEWRVGDEVASERAANLAMDVAQSTGSLYALTLGLRAYPDVLSRQIDASLDPDSVWHEIGRHILDTGGRADTVASGSDSVHLVSFGLPGIRVNSRLHALPLVKCAELIDYLIEHGGSAKKCDLIRDLFESKSTKSAQAYLRMAGNKIRTVPGLEEALDTEGDTVAWTCGRLTSDVSNLRTGLGQVRRTTGRRRYQYVQQLLAALPCEEYLVGARSRWVNRQRDNIAELAVEIRQAAAEAAFEVSDYLAAHQLVSEVLDEDPYRESAWRLKMKAAAALGQGDRVVAIYRACERALAEVPVKPADSTRRLVEQLRL